jgi:membrane associated rhomboid family serine protease
MDNYDIENKKISSHTFIFPTLLLLLIALVKSFELKTGSNWSGLGVYPKSIEGLKGIILAPFIHGSIKHLFNNIVPLFFLLSAMIHFYDKLAYIIYMVIHIGCGVILWFIGREVFHIGASGVVYGLASFMFFSGIFRRNTQLLAFSLLITFLYGSMVWGIFPETVKKGVSWEAHLSGAIIGLILSIVLLKTGPQRKKYEWEEEDEEDEEEYIYHIIDK